MVREVWPSHCWIRRTTDASFQQVRGPGVAQGVDGHVLVHAGFLDSDTKGALDTIHDHGLGGGMNGASVRVNGRKQEAWVVMGQPLRS